MCVCVLFIKWLYLHIFLIWKRQGINKIINSNMCHWCIFWKERIQILCLFHKHVWQNRFLRFSERIVKDIVFRCKQQSGLTRFYLTHSFCYRCLRCVVKFFLVFKLSKAILSWHDICLLPLGASTGVIFVIRVQNYEVLLSGLPLREIPNRHQ